jgi:double-stranded uracil-DNA glycosylase
LHLAGLIDWSVETDTGMSDSQRASLVEAGIGISNLVARATVRASELSREELRAGGERLVALVEQVRPHLVAVAGVTAFRDAFGQRAAALGRQPVDIGPAQLWVVPNPSGLNAHETIESLAGWYSTVATEAGVT